MKMRRSVKKVHVVGCKEVLQNVCAPLLNCSAWKEGVFRAWSSFERVSVK